jgi:steroid delta-isomerase-like uncharacterized protein
MVNAPGKCVAAETARQFMGYYTAGDVGAMAALCAPDAVLNYVAMGDRGVGNIHEIGVPLWRAFVDAFEGFSPEIVEVWEDSDRNTAFVSTINRGTQRKDIAGVTANNRELAAQHLFIVALANDGRIAKLSAYWDYLTMYRQLGFPKDLVTEVARSK